LVKEIDPMVQKTLGEGRGLIIASFVNELLKGGGKIQGWSNLSTYAALLIHN
jgi:hypothetical protein